MIPSIYSSRIKILFIVGLIIGILFVYFNFQHKSVEVLHSPAKPKGKICLIIDDFGYSENELTREFLYLPNDFTVSIIPGHTYSEDIAHLASKYGFETMVHMPMEPFDWDGESEKEFRLSGNLNFDEVFERVSNSFDENPWALGMNNHQGSKATENLQLMKDLARSLQQLDKYFIDSFTSPESRAFITMRQMGVKTEIRQIFLDHQENPDSVRQKFNDLLKLADMMDVVVGICHVKPATYKILKEQIPLLKQKGYEFLTASEVVR